mgnify:CR=1 FL=1
MLSPEDVERLRDRAAEASGNRHVGVIGTRGTVDLAAMFG